MSSTAESATVGYYEIRHAVNRKYQKKTWWMRIGSATELNTGAIVARIEAVPLNWDGTFHLFPSKETEDSE